MINERVSKTSGGSFHYNSEEYSQAVDKRNLKSSRRSQHRIVDVGHRHQSRTSLYSVISNQLLACNSIPDQHMEDVEEFHKAKAKNRDTHQQPQSPRSVFHPILRTFECGRSEWATSTHNQTSPKFESLTVSDYDDDNECSLSSKLDALKKQQQKNRRDTIKYAMYSFFARESMNINSNCPVPSKRVRFHAPLVTSIVQIPRIPDDDIHHFFFTAKELEQIQQDCSNTFDSENIESVLINSSRPRKDLYYVLQRSCDQTDSMPSISTSNHQLFLEEQIKISNGPRRTRQFKCS